MIDLPKEFRHRISATWGAEGREWLEHLPGLILHCQKQWSLSINPTLPALSYNFVAFAIRRDGSQVVLKIGVPRDELMSEIEALRLFNGDGACRLLEADEEKGFLLLERLRPGVMLATLEDDDEATHIAAEVMKRIWKPLDSGMPRLRQIRLGRELPDGQVAVLAGLDAGEAVVTDPDAARTALLGERR